MTDYSYAYEQTNCLCMHFILVIVIVTTRVLFSGSPRVCVEQRSTAQDRVFRMSTCGGTSGPRKNSSRDRASRPKGSICTRSWRLKAQTAHPHESRRFGTVAAWFLGSGLHAPICAQMFPHELSPPALAAPLRVGSGLLGPPRLQGKATAGQTCGKHDAFASGFVRQSRPKAPPQLAAMYEPWMGALAAQHGLRETKPKPMPASKIPSTKCIQNT